MEGKEGERPPRGQYPRRGKPVQVIGRWSGWIVCNELCTVLVHWTGERTVPCRRFLHSESCEHCENDVPDREENWLLVQDGEGRYRPQLFKPTPHAIESCPKLAELAGDLWGSYLVATRSKNPVNGPMTLVLERPQAIPRIVARPVLVLPALEALWRGNGKRKGGGS